MMTGAFRAAARVALARCGEPLRRIQQRGGPIAAGMKRLKAWLNTRPSSIELERVYSRQAIYDWSKAERLLDYRPSVGIDQGLRYSVDWLRYAGLLV